MARKGFYEELATKKYLSTITPKMFKYVEEVFDGEDRAEKKELVKALLPKIIDKSLPTQFTGDEGGAIVIQIAEQVAHKYDITSSASTDSK